MMAAMRTGSNLLEANLNAIDGVICHGEVFNQHFIGGLNQTALFGIDMAGRRADPGALLTRIKQKSEGLSGFRYFNDHDPRVFDLVMNDPTCAKIILTRNPLESYISLLIARDTNQWKLTKTKRHKSALPHFDAAEFETFLQEAQEFQVRIVNALQKTGQAGFYIDYEDVQDLDVVNGLAAFLDVPGRLKSLDSALKKQNPEAMSDKVANVAEMEQALAQLDRFNLARTPNFEPRRSAAVPQYLASQRVGLMFMPVKGAADAQVRQWLEHFGPVVTNFDRKLLRSWKAQHPGYRSFTVVRHPLARAHAVFCDVVAQTGSPEVRAYLTREYDLTLPERGAAFASADAFRAAFVTFLEFLRHNLNAQTGLKVMPPFASQSAVLQGLADVQTPDLVIREGRLAEGLAYIASEAGVDCPTVPAATAIDGVALAAIYGPDLETACRAAYAKDYEAFGFGDWTPQAA